MIRKDGKRGMRIVIYKLDPTETIVSQKDFPEDVTLQFVAILDRAVVELGL